MDEEPSHSDFPLVMTAMITTRCSIWRSKPSEQLRLVDYSNLFDLTRGDIYLTSPTAIYHGIGVPTLTEPER